MLSAGNYFTTASGMLQTQGTSQAATAFADAISRASRGDRAIGISGIGVPLIGQDGERAAAYVLPIAGKDLRGDLGHGHCAVFIARRGEQQPMALELLRTIFDLTVMEARVTLLVAQGQGALEIAEGLKITVSTVRSHLKHAFAKTGATNQSALGALVNGLMPPVGGG
jgi:DNA-binding CsgD family transcriptional regulator